MQCLVPADRLWLTHSSDEVHVLHVLLCCGELLCHSFWVLQGFADSATAYCAVMSLTPTAHQWHCCRAVGLVKKSC